MPRPLAVLALLLLAPVAANAADCVLKDGRVLHDAKVIRHDAATVTFRHAHGFTQVEKSKLPEPLAADYPFDEALARRDAALQARAAEARAAESRRRLAEQAQRAAAAPMPTDDPAPEPATPPAYSPAPAPVPWYAWKPSWNHHWHYPRRPQSASPARATPPSWELQMTPDVRMTPDLHTSNASPAPNPPPEETEEEPPPPCPRPRRSR